MILSLPHHLKVRLYGTKGNNTESHVVELAAVAQSHLGAILVHL